VRERAHRILKRPEPFGFRQSSVHGHAFQLVTKFCRALGERLKSVDEAVTRISRSMYQPYPAGSRAVDGLQLGAADSRHARV